MASVGWEQDPFQLFCRPGQKLQAISQLCGIHFHSVVFLPDAYWPHDPDVTPCVFVQPCQPITLPASQSVQYFIEVFKCKPQTGCIVARQVALFRTVFCVAWSGAWYLTVSSLACSQYVITKLTLYASCVANIAPCEDDNKKTNMQAITHSAQRDTRCLFQLIFFSYYLNLAGNKYTLL